MNRPDYNTTLQAWADIVIDIWEDKVLAMNIQGNALLESFTNHVVLNSNGDPERIEFAFNFYGKFVDMGVGNGISLSDQTAGTITKRKPKPWYSKTFFYQVHKLGKVLSEKYGQEAVALVTDNLSNA